MHFQVHLRVSWLPTSQKVSHYKETKGKMHSRALIAVYLHSCTLPGDLNEKDQTQEVRFHSDEQDLSLKSRSASMS